jgi:hypothetical protein
MENSVTIKRRPDIMPSITRRVYFACGHAYLSINGEDKQPAQVLVRIGKSGCCQRALLEAICRLVNRDLDRGVPLEEITMCLCGLACDQGVAGAGKLSCVDALARALKLFALGLVEEQKEEKHP